MIGRQSRDSGAPRRDRATWRSERASGGVADQLLSTSEAMWNAAGVAITNPSLIWSGWATL
jgi:hypothetical protein